MRVPRIYTPQALAAGATLNLDAAASRHLCQVLRLGPGHPLVLFNGDGDAFDARLDQADRKGAAVMILDRRPDPETESPLRIHLGIALSKGDRFDWVLQKATELGVSAITPLQTQRVDVRLNRERSEKKQRHWQQVLISACEQSGRNHLPVLAHSTPLDTWLEAVDADAKWVLCPDQTGSLESSAPPTSIALLVGPEGGLEEAEIERAQRSGFRALQLGPRVLRTETAPLAAIAILQHRWGDL